MEVTRLSEKVFRIRTPFGGEGNVFLYLIRADRIALVDTGTATSPTDVLEPALFSIGLGLSDIDCILNTHAHLDHSGGNLAVKRASDAQIHVHAADRPMALSTEAQVDFMTAPLRILGFPEELVEKRAAHVRKMAGQAAGADVLLSEGDVVDLGGDVRLRVVHSPGHTPGSICYHWEKEGILFTGDSVVGHGSRMGAYPLYFDAESYRRSLVKLMQMDFRALYLGHAYLGGSLVNDPLRAGDDAREFLKESLRVADTIQREMEQAVRRNPWTPSREVALAALAELRYLLPQLLVRDTDMPASAGPTLVAHLQATNSGSYPWAL